MGTPTEQARQAVAATRGQVEASADRLEARLRRDLDPRQRLRRDGPKLAAGIAVVVLVGTVYVARSRRRRHRDEPDARDWIAEMPPEWRDRLQALLAEAATGGALPAGSGRPHRGRQGSMAASLAARAARMVAPALIAAAAERIGRRATAGQTEFLPS